ncbi:MAG TPA: hypothetical protein VF100_04165, partial [Thermoanaerobaculia bacterium]
MSRSSLTAAALVAAIALALPAAGQAPPSATPAPPPAGPVTVDLAAAVEFALARNPALAASAERRREVAGGVREVRADARPQLSALASYGASRN